MRTFVGINTQFMHYASALCRLTGIIFNQIISRNKTGIDFDNGCFQRIVYGSEAVSKALDIRKNGERPFNLLKKREGLEQVRVRSHHGVVVRTTFTTLATLLLELAGTRRTKKLKQEQIKLPLVS